MSPYSAAHIYTNMQEKPENNGIIWNNGTLRAGSKQMPVVMGNREFIWSGLNNYAYRGM